MYYRNRRTQGKEFPQHKVIVTPLPSSTPLKGERTHFPNLSTEGRTNSMTLGIGDKISDGVAGIYTRYTLKTSEAHKQRRERRCSHLPHWRGRHPRSLQCPGSRLPRHGHARPAPVIWASRRPTEKGPGAQHVQEMRRRDKHRGDESDDTQHKICRRLDALETDDVQTTRRYGCHTGGPNLKGPGCAEDGSRRPNGPRKCVRLCTKDAYENHTILSPVPAMAYSRMDVVLLKLHEMRFDDMMRFPFKDPPSVEVLYRAKEDLMDM